MTLQLNSRADFTIENYAKAAWDGAPVAFSATALQRMADCRTAFMQLIDSDPDVTIYGVTSGYGQFARMRLKPDERRLTQRSQWCRSATPKRQSGRRSAPFYPAAKAAASVRTMPPRLPSSLGVDRSRPPTALAAALAALAVVAAQALHVTRRAAPPALRELLAEIHLQVPPAEESRPIAPDMERLVAALRSNIYGSARLSRPRLPKTLEDFAVDREITGRDHFEIGL